MWELTWNIFLSAIAWLIGTINALNIDLPPSKEEPTLKYVDICPEPRVPFSRVYPLGLAAIQYKVECL